MAEGWGCDLGLQRLPWCLLSLQEVARCPEEDHSDYRNCSLDSCSQLYVHQAKTADSC